MFKLRDIRPDKPVVLKRWGPREALYIDRLVREGLVDWSIHGGFYPKHGRCKSWHFEGARISLTTKGKLLWRKRAAQVA